MQQILFGLLGYILIAWGFGAILQDFFRCKVYGEFTPLHIMISSGILFLGIWVLHYFG